MCIGKKSRRRISAQRANGGKEGEKKEIWKIEKFGRFFLSVLSEYLGITSYALELYAASVH